MVGRDPNHSRIKVRQTLSCFWVSRPDEMTGALMLRASKATLGGDWSPKGRRRFRCGRAGLAVPVPVWGGRGGPVGPSRVVTWGFGDLVIGLVRRGKSSKACLAGEVGFSCQLDGPKELSLYLALCIGRIERKRGRMGQRKNDREQEKKELDVLPVRGASGCEWVRVGASGRGCAGRLRPLAGVLVLQRLLPINHCVSLGC